MKKKIYIMLLIISVMCASYSAHVYANYEKLYDEIESQMPEIITSFDELPSTSKNSYFINYYIDDKILTKNTIFDKSLDEQPQEVVISIKHFFTHKQYILNVKSESVKFEDLTPYFKDVFSFIDASFPQKIEGDTPLPYFSDDTNKVTYTSSCVTISEGVIIYDFPEVNYDCTVTAHVESKNQKIRKSYNIEVYALSRISRVPVVSIDTTGKTAITKKSEMISADLSVKAYNHEEHSDFNNEPILIRLRGNSTLSMPKKSYKISFLEQKKFLNDYKETDWVLLANYSDQTQIRNALAFMMSANLQSNFAPSVTFVELYVNDVYEGLYLLTDQIQVTHDRVNIEEHTDNLDTGYLLEYDIGITRYPDTLAATNHIVAGGRTFVIKSPNNQSESVTEAQNKYISDYMNSLIDSLKAKEDYSELIDEQSFIDWYIVNEVFKNCDVGFSSTYLYKDAGSKLYMGPVWDFDFSTGNSGHMGEKNGPYDFYTHYRNYLFDLLMRYDVFREHLQDRWNDVYEDKIVSILDEVYPLSISITRARNYNFTRWDVIGKNNKWYTADEVLAMDTYHEQVFYMYQFLVERIEWLNVEINKL